MGSSADPLRLAVLGATVGNGHPYSWSAILNGYDRTLMRDECPFPAIPNYLDRQKPGAFGDLGARVTHVHCSGDGNFDAAHVARLSLIPHVVDNPTGVIGHVDAVLIATDRGSEHVDRARPFVEAGVPVFIDKPLTDNLDDLQTFRGWVADGARLMSSSSMRYAPEFQPYHRGMPHDLGDLRLATVTSPKSWAAYGMHALEAIYPVLGPGFVSARNTGSGDHNVVHLRHRDDVDVVAVVTSDMYGAFGLLQLAGTTSSIQLRSQDTFSAFKAQLADFIKYLVTNERPYPFEETDELTQLLIAAHISRLENGREVLLDELA